MKKGLIVLLVLLLPVVVYAEIEYNEIYKDYVKEWSNLTVDNQKFYIRTIELDDNYMTKIDLPSGKSTLIRYIKDPDLDCYILDNITCPCLNNTCGCIKDDVYDVCVLGIKRGDEDEFDTVEVRYPLYSHIRIRKAQPEITLEKEYLKTTQISGSRSKVEVTIKNDGSDHVKSAFYEEEYPEDFRLTDCSGCTIVNNKIEWQGTLYIGAEEKFTYFMYPGKPGKYEFTSILHYNSKNITKKDNIDIIDVVPNISTVLVPAYPSLGDDSELNIFITNNNSKNDISSLTYKIYIPKEFEVYHAHHLDSLLDYYHFTESFPISSSETAFIKFVPKKTGNYQITEEIEYTVNDSTTKISNTYEVNITTQAPYAKPILPSSYKEGSTVQIPITIVNADPFQTYRSIDIVIESTLPQLNAKANIDKIGPKESKTPIELPFTYRGNAEKINITIIFSTQFNEIIKTQRTLELGHIDEKPVEPVSTPIEPTINDTVEVTPDEPKNPFSAILKSGSGAIAIIFTIFLIIIYLFLVIFIFRPRHKE